MSGRGRRGKPILSRKSRTSLNSTQERGTRLITEDYNYEGEGNAPLKDDLITSPKAD